MSCDLKLYIGSGNVVEWQELTNSVTGVVDTGATMTVTLKDSAGEEVDGQVWPATMAHDAAGTYRATLEDDLDLTVGDTYTAEITVTGSGGEPGFRRVHAEAGYQGRN